jgi:hypothetical protein
MTININLDETTTINFTNLRQGNAFGFRFNININGTPIVAEDYDIMLELKQGGKSVLKILNADWTKDGSTITKLYNSFPLPTGAYTWHCTYINTSGQVVTIVPGSLTIITKDARTN